jgi:RNA polymerase sigma-70 factor, ECF subfamily
MRSAKKSFVPCRYSATQKLAPRHLIASGIACGLHRNRNGARAAIVANSALERERLMSSLMPVYEPTRISTQPQVTREPQLIAALTQNDSATFEVLASRYRRLVLAYVCRITKSVIEAEDLTQQVLMKAFASYSSFEGRSSFSTWLISIARNEALMWCRKTKRAREIPMVGENSGSYLDFTDPQPNPEFSCLEKERKQLLFGELKKMKPANREVLELCDLDEQSVPEAAMILGISTTALKSRRFRGRAVLRKRLKSKLLPSQSRVCSDASTLHSSIHDQEVELDLR